jgi:ABC-type Na+ efflux pump permease subunit
MIGVELAGFVASLAGTTLSIVFGKLLAALVLAAVAVGIFLRLAGRRKQAPVANFAMPPWLQATCAFLSVIEVGLLTEATNLPVRLNQPDFEKINWLFVLLALLALYFIQLRFFHSIFKKRNANTLPTQP